MEETVSLAGFARMFSRLTAIARCRVVMLCGLAVLLPSWLFAAGGPVGPVDPVMIFEDVGLAESGFVTKEGITNFFLAGAVDGHDEASGARVEADVEQKGLRGCFMHPPYKHGYGSSFQQFVIKLPSTPTGSVEGFTALRDGAEKSDGVTYRMLVNGRPVWEENRKSPDWQPFSADLSPWTGQVVTICFEVTPGPKHDTAFDWALWGNRRLILPGLDTMPKHPGPRALDLKKMSSRQNQSWVPLSGFEGKITRQFDLDANNAKLSYEGPDGELTYILSLSHGPLPSIILQAKMTGDRMVEVPLCTDAAISWTCDVKRGLSQFRSRRSTVVQYESSFANSAGEIALLTVKGQIVEKSLVLDVSCDKPWIKEISPGNWGPVAFRRRMPMPYYGHAIDFFPAENMFVSSFPDWTASSAASFNRNRAVYSALTDGSRHLMRERFVFSAAWHIDEVMANIPNPPSPWREDFSRRVVFDIWGGKFEENARALEDIAKYGVKDGFIILHDWQRDGYDNGLPAHFPANSRYGGESAMKDLSQTARRLGYRLSLHENYVDYYPNYEHFTTNDISVRSDGKLEDAWYNPGTKIQSFAIKPSAIMRLAHEQTPEIHKRYDTTGGYLDVHSCVHLWFHVDHQAGVPGAGELQSVWNAHRELWAYGRKVHEGPMTGEGNGHWPWSGYLDGVEAQFGTGWGHHSGRTAPLLVDFNLLRVHPLQLNHGQGYYDRWLEKTHSWGGGMPMVVLDQYRMQEAVFGHIGFLSGNFWRRPGTAWLEQNLMVPLTVRHSTETVKDICYFVDGKWADTTAAAKASSFNRVRVIYDNGLMVTANGEEKDWDVDGIVLPQFGWVARGKEFEGGTVCRDGVVVDYVNSPDYQFANARRFRDWNFGAPAQVRVEVAGFDVLENRRIRVSYEWKCNGAVTRDLRCFVHFDKPGKNDYHWEALMQQDHNLKKPTMAWAKGEIVKDGPYEIDIPDGAADGRYAWHIGLCDKQGRLALDGPDDGQARIKLGELVISGGGKIVSFVPFKQDGVSASEWYGQHLNTDEKVVDFGFVKTDGSVLRKREGKEWKQWMYPLPADFKIEFRK